MQLNITHHGITETVKPARSPKPGHFAYRDANGVLITIPVDKIMHVTVAVEIADDAK